MKEILLPPSYWVCGAGGNVSCENWDDVNGCWNNCKNAIKCPILAQSEEDRDDLCESDEE